MEFKKFHSTIKLIAEVLPKLRETAKHIKSQKMMRDLNFTKGKVITTYEPDGGATVGVSEGYEKVNQIFCYMMSANGTEHSSVFPEFDELSISKHPKGVIDIQFALDDWADDWSGEYSPYNKTITFNNLGVYPYESTEDLEAICFALSTVCEKVMPFEELKEIFNSIDILLASMEKGDTITLDTDDLSVATKANFNKILHPRISYV